MRAGARHRDVLARPAVGAETVTREPDRGDEIVDSLKRKRGKVQLFANELDHALVGLAVRIDVLRYVGVLPLVPANVAASERRVIRSYSFFEREKLMKRQG